MTTVRRVAVYIDGFNLYHGLKQAHGRKYLWLDLEAVARRLLRPGQELTAVHYFTAMVRDDPDAEARQKTYLAALGVASTAIDVHLGRFQSKSMTCRSCGGRWRTFEEKQTDVHVAVTLLEDGVTDVFDTAIVLSADADLVPAAMSLKRLKPNKRLIAVFPPRRHSDHLSRAVHANFTLGEAIIRQCQLPAELADAAGAKIARPTRWK